MPLEHLKYESNGRKLLVRDDEGHLTGQECYKSRGPGHENILHNGSYVPYIKDEKTKTLTFKRSQLKLTDIGIEFYIWDKKTGSYVLRTTASFHPEIKELDIWNRKIATASQLAWKKIDDDFGDKAKASYTISTSDMDIKVNIEVGGSANAEFYFDITPKVLGKEQRIIWHTDELEEAIPIQAVFLTKKSKSIRTVGYRFAGYKIKWNYAEAVERKAEGVAADEETKIIIGEKLYSSLSTIRIRPDQWGETGVTNNIDDGSEGATDGWLYDTVNSFDADGAPCGNSLTWFSTTQDYAFAARWLNVTIAANPTSVDIGTQIEYDVGYLEEAFTFIVYGLEGDTPAFNVTAPSARTKTTASASFAAPAAGNDNIIDGVDFRAVIKEILDTGWSSGFDLGALFDKGNAGSDVGFQVDDDTTGVGARITIVYTPAVGGYTLIADSGSYSKTGQAVGLLAGRKLAVDSGSLAITGTAAGLLRGYPLIAEAGSLILSGQDTGLIKDSRISVESGSFALSGQDVSLLKGGRISIGSGAYDITGQDAALLRGLLINIESGAYNKTGSVVDLLRGFAIAAQNGTYNLSGQIAALLKNSLIAIESGAYALTGSDVTLTYTPVGGYTLIADSGTYNLTGVAADLLRGYRLGAEAGSLALSGQDVSLLSNHLLNAATGSYNISGQDVSLLRNFLISLEAGGYNITGQDISFLRSYVLNMESGSFILNGQDVTLTYSGEITIIGCLHMILSSKQPSIEFDNKQPSVIFDSKQPSITFQGKCDL